MGRKPFKTAKMKNPAASGGEKHNVNSSIEENFCFICDRVTGGKSISLMMTYTPYTHIDLPRKIGQLMGDGFMVIVDGSDTLCGRCLSLINQLDKLEFDADKLKNELTEFLKVKYQLSEPPDDSQGEDMVIDNQFEDCIDSATKANVENHVSSGVDVKSSVNGVKCDTVASSEIKTEVPKVEECGNEIDGELNSINGNIDDSLFNSLAKEYMLENISETDVDTLINSQTDCVTLYKCNACKYETLVLDNFVEHLKSHSRKILYKCTECHQKFETQDEVQHHVLKVHGAPDIQYYENMRELESDPDYYPSSKKMYECNSCKFRHNNKKVFDAHVRKHVKSETFVCRICSKVFKHKITLKKHMFNHRTYKCKLCSAVFQNAASLSHHFKVHNHDIKIHNECVSDEPTVARDSAPSSLDGISTLISSTANNGEKDELELGDELEEDNPYDQVEVLLEKLHADVPEESNLLLENTVIVKETSGNVMKDEESQDTKDIEHNVKVPAFVQNDQSVAFSEDTRVEQMKQFIKNSGHFLDVSHNENAENCENNSEMLKILDDAENVENIIFTPNLYDEVEKEDEETVISNGDEQKPRKVFICCLCGLKTPSHAHIKRHFKCHIALERKTYKCHICERVLTTRSNLKRHISLHENCGSGEVQCNMCDEVLTDRLHLKHHMEIKHPESYQCSFCDRRFDSKKACRDHEVTHPALQCDVCQKMFLTEGRLKSHKQFMHNESSQDVPKTKTFKCHICFKILTTYHNLKRHLRNHEKCSGLVKCVLCDQELADKLHLRQHVEENHPESHQCSFCHKVFSNRKSCKSHEMTHPERFVYKCDSCEKLFLTEARLKRHQDIMHRDPHCRTCGKEIANPLKLLDHERRHERHKVMFPCDQCPKVFRTPSGLKYHMSVHTGKYAVYCEICGKGLHSEVVLEEHKATHTKEVRYTCEKCGRTFSSNSTYRMHRLWHDNPLPYKCNICDRKFKHTSILAVHKRRAHTGERPYKCPYCSLTFSVSSTLNKHVILHTKQYPYRCTQCTKGFTTRTKIAKHMAKVHNDFEMLNSKKKPCEYKMVLHPNELPAVPKESAPASQETQETRTDVEEEEAQTATLVLEHVSMDSVDPTQAIFTIFQEDLPSSDFTLHEFNTAEMK